MVTLPIGLAALPTQPALPPVPAAAIFYHRFAAAMLALLAQLLTELPSKINTY
jgi:hypothetical protein